MDNLLFDLDFVKKFKEEKQLNENNQALVAGIDEAGRGPLAGPVVCAAVIMPLDKKIQGIDDSKKVTQQKREELFEIIKKVALAYSISVIDNIEIDRLNILKATMQGMEQAANGLKIKPDFILIDAVKGLDTGCPNYPIIKGDEQSYNIAAASILAKVFRDRLMKEYALSYPNYGFEKHKGYPTAAHIKALIAFGKCPIHRESFLKNFQTAMKEAEKSV